MPHSSSVARNGSAMEGAEARMVSSPKAGSSPGRVTTAPASAATKAPAAQSQRCSPCSTKASTHPAATAQRSSAAELCLRMSRILLNNLARELGLAHALIGVVGESGAQQRQAQGASARNTERDGRPTRPPSPGGRPAPSADGFDDRTGHGHPVDLRGQRDRERRQSVEEVHRPVDRVTTHVTPVSSGNPRRCRTLLPEDRFVRAQLGQPFADQSSDACPSR